MLPGAERNRLFPGSHPPRSPPPLARRLPSTHFSTEHPASQASPLIDALEKVQQSPLKALLEDGVRADTGLRS